MKVSFLSALEVSYDFFIDTNYEEVVNILEKHDSIFEPRTFVDLRLYKSTIRQSFADIIKPVMRSLLETIKAFVEFE